MKRLKCYACERHTATRKDYRFIDGTGLQGSCYMCEWCEPLDDTTVYQIISEKLDPKSFFDEKGDLCQSKKY